jgi:CII-binding regulator of phage lambda lysogenization HflD
MDSSSPCVALLRSRSENAAVFSKIMSILKQVCVRMRSESDRLQNLDPTLPTTTTKPSLLTKQPRASFAGPETGFTALWAELFSRATKMPTLGTLLESDFVSRLVLIESVYSALWGDLESQMRVPLRQLDSASHRAASAQQSYQKYCESLVAVQQQLDSQPKLKATFGDRIITLRPVQDAAMGALSELNDLRQQLLPTLERLSLDAERVEQSLYEEIDKAIRDLGETLSTLVDSYQQLLAHLKERVQSASSQADVEDSLRLAEHPAEVVVAQWQPPPLNFDLTSKVSDSQLAQLFADEAAKATGEVRDGVDGCAPGERVTILADTTGVLTIERQDGTILTAPAEKVQVTFRRKIKKLSASVEAVSEGEKVLVIGEDGENALCTTVLGQVMSIPADKLLES